MKYELHFISIVAVMALSVPLGAFAISFSSQAEMSLAVSPEFPRPGENIKVGVRSYVFDTLRANMQWYLNGKVVASGRGVAEQIFTADKVGSVMTIRVEAIAADGATYETSAVIPISDIDLIARALTYAPKSYRGTTLPTPGSVLEVYATPYLYAGGAKLAAKNLIYEWSVNDQKISAQSGGGRVKLRAALPNLSGGEIKVSLKASNLSGSVYAVRSMKIAMKSPEVVFYKNDSLTGRGVSALFNLRIPAGSAFSVIAEPYFMAMDSLSKAAILWKVGGLDITQASETPRILEISAPKDSSGGSTDFAVSIADATKLFQKAVGNLTVFAQ